MEYHSLHEIRAVVIQLLVLLQFRTLIIHVVILSLFVKLVFWKGDKKKKFDFSSYSFYLTPHLGGARRGIYLFLFLHQQMRIFCG